MLCFSCGMVFGGNRNGNTLAVDTKVVCLEKGCGYAPVLLAKGSSSLGV